MRVALISPYPDITAYGVRAIAAFLKANGVAVRLIFLPDPLGDALTDCPERYPAAVMEQTAALCADCDLVGVSLMTNYVDNAVQITRAVKAKTGVPVLWGGVHPTIRPEECLELADLVCVGDGEEAILDVVRAIEADGDLTTIANIQARRTDGTMARNAVRPLTQNLDALPAPDWSHEDHHIWDSQNPLAGVVPLTPAATEAILARGTVSLLLGKIGYQTMTGRGCPHRCAYCVNDAIKALYGAKGYLRWRGTDHVLAEIETVRRILPDIGYVWISDDAFFARPLADIVEFCRQWKTRIGLPFSCLGSPATISREKMDALLDAGLFYLQMGVQTGSPRIQKLFNRQAMGNEVMLAAMRIINASKDRMFPPSYDFILDTPYETTADRLESVRFIAQIPKPFRLQPFSLVLYPGTKLHAMAAADGFLTDERRQVYTKSYTMRRPDYINLLILLAKGGRMPSRLLALLASDAVAGVLVRPLFNPLWQGLFALMGPAKRLLRRVSGRA
ncbi:radical SAM protein [Desulfovibrio aerotolerans]|uniref:Radical SAM protein n=1 Tax=Solidesulfovibrio aerotolerans TaxID=295255 RepID=A0A7C9MIZ3_9BACT|nr:radical SAM protein [Solidesulfovibrio aerotolerans]MYL81773.1 radical SAM protein [Solidesulfovibrio aerotolerans]